MQERCRAACRTVGGVTAGHRVPAFHVEHTALLRSPEYRCFDTSSVGLDHRHDPYRLGDVILWVAGFHAMAALFHLFILKDGVLASMPPAWLLRMPAPRN